MKLIYFFYNNVNIPLQVSIIQEIVRPVLESLALNTQVKEIKTDAEEWQYT